jgi:hypothetical protein
MGSTKQTVAIGIASVVAAANVVAACILVGHRIVPGIAEARTLVAKIVVEPGWDRQMCGIVESNTAGFSPYAFQRVDERVTQENLLLCRARREAVIAAIVERLPKDIRGATAGDHLSVYESYPFTHELAILCDLNAVEALPCLLASLEEVSPRPGFEVARNDLLSTITAILRQESYGPLLASDIEAKFRTALEDQMKRYEYYSERVENGTIAPKYRYRYAFDERAKATREFQRLIIIPVTAALEAEVRGWARDFLDRTPEEARLGARGMDPWPILH